MRRLLCRLASLGWLIAVPTSAAVLAVTSTLDAIDAVPGDGLCATADGDCTLRAAILEANALPDADEIDLPAGTFALAIPGRSEDAGAMGDLDITDDLTIRGAGADSTIVDAAALDRVVHVRDESFPPARVSIVDLALTGGLDTGMTGFYPGGGAALVDVDGVGLTLDGVIVSGNEAENGGGILIKADGSGLVLRSTQVTGNTARKEGGGIWGAGGGFTLEDSEVIANWALDGGGLWADGDFVGHPVVVRRSRIAANVATNRRVGGVNLGPAWATLVDSVVTDNEGSGVRIGGDGVVAVQRTTIAGNVGALAGGVQFENNGGGSTTILDSTISGNESLACGGGIGIFGQMPIHVANTTISGNVATTLGGGICMQTFFGGAHFSNVTITRNVAATGGGITIVGAVDQTFRFRNSILAQNTAGSSPDCYQTSLDFPTSRGHNLIGDVGSCAWTPQTGDRIGTALDPIDAELGPLILDSGMTRVHRPLAGSPARDAGSPLPPTGAAGDLWNDSCLPTDQRGLTRPRDSDEDSIARCDIGAVEVGNPQSCGLGSELALGLAILMARRRRIAIGS